MWGRSNLPSSPSAAIHQLSGNLDACGLYTESQRLRRDATVWTLVQGVLAPIQFLIFLISLTLVLRYLVLESGYEAAAISVVVKTTALYLIMITGAACGVCQRSCPLISCGVSDFWDAGFAFGVEPNGPSRLPVAGFA